jgi:xylulokinase
MGIDIATTGAKTIIIDKNGRIIGDGFGSYPTSTPKPGWAEQKPQDWWKAVVTSIKSSLRTAGVDSADIKAIGLSGQMHGATFLDDMGKPLRPCIIWADSRTSSQCEKINKIFGPMKFIKLTLNAPLASFTAGKILWVRENEPVTFKKTQKVLLPKDYIRYKLTGEYKSDVSDASGTALFDVKMRNWSKQVLSGLGIPFSMMPEVIESSVPAGRISRRAAEQTGLREGTLLVAGAGDVAASAVGCGAIKEGVVLIILGSGGVVFATTNKPALDTHGSMQSFCHAVPNKWHIMGVILSCTFALRYFKETFYRNGSLSKRGEDAYEMMNKEASGVKPGSDGLIFLPYLSGERTPHKDPFARGCFIGMSLAHKRGHYVRAIMEGVGYALRDSFELIKECGVRINEVRLTGGGAKSSLWTQILSDIFNCPVVTTNITESSAHGAALLAGVGCGIYRDIEEGCKKTIKTVKTVKPVKQSTNIYDEYYKIYRTLYPSLKEEFKKISKCVEKT